MLLTALKTQIEPLRGIPAVTAIVRTISPSVKAKETDFFEIQTKTNL
jgi:hypothetical protein